LAARAGIFLSDQVLVYIGPSVPLAANNPRRIPVTASFRSVFFAADHDSIDLRPLFRVLPFHDQRHFPAKTAMAPEFSEAIARVFHR
jgi:hypothetical protein